MISLRKERREEPVDVRALIKGRTFFFEDEVSLERGGRCVRFRINGAPFDEKQDFAFVEYLLHTVPGITFEDVVTNEAQTIYVFLLDRGTVRSKVMEGIRTALPCPERDIDIRM